MSLKRQTVEEMKRCWRAWHTIMIPDYLAFLKEVKKTMQKAEKLSESLSLTHLQMTTL